MARRYTRDNRGRFASTGTGATARGGRLKTEAGNKRATQTIQAGSRAGVIGKARSASARPAPAPNAPKQIKYTVAYHGTSAKAAADIKRGKGYRESAASETLYGSAVYTSTNLGTARGYRSGPDGQVIRHRVPKTRIETTSGASTTAAKTIIGTGKAARIKTSDDPFTDQKIIMMGKQHADKTVDSRPFIWRNQDPRTPFQRKVSRDSVRMGLEKPRVKAPLRTRTKPKRK
jgi:hypothetical protein